MLSGSWQMVVRSGRGWAEYEWGCREYFRKVKKVCKKIVGMGVLVREVVMMRGNMFSSVKIPCILLAVFNLNESLDEVHDSYGWHLYHPIFLGKARSAYGDGLFFLSW